MALFSGIKSHRQVYVPVLVTSFRFSLPFLLLYFFVSQELISFDSLAMHFTLFFISFFFVLTRSAPTAPLDNTTLLNNALEAQQLNAQFQSANGTATGSCNSKRATNLSLSRGC
jgi:hypothetical protein